MLKLAWPPLAKAGPCLSFSTRRDSAIRFSRDAELEPVTGGIGETFSVGSNLRTDTPTTCRETAPRICLCGYCIAEEAARYLLRSDLFRRTASGHSFNATYG